MSYRQAFHTSCRNGLSGHAGFQFNAASGGLDDEQLARLAAAHAGYAMAPDAPIEPDAEQIKQLPVSLRYLPVEGVGAVVSRTAYVGREFRGADAEADSGRFGNYFSHIVVAAEGGFDGLLPVELWGAPHWTTREAPATALPLLERIEPGPVDLDGMLAQLLPDRAPALAPVLDACLRAVLGGPRVVVVEPDPTLAAPWIAWASFALPPQLTGELTFTTFDGRPRVAEGVRLCLTTPGCDVGFAAYELGTAVNVVSTTEPLATDLSLYARVAASLAGDGAEAVVAAVRELPAGLGVEAAGAQLAVLGDRVALASAAEVAGVVAALCERVSRTPTPTLVALSLGVPADSSAESLSEWARLHALARGSEDPDAVGLADESLRRLLGSLEQGATASEEVASGSPTQPSVGVLAAWLEQVSAAVGSERLGPAVAAGVRLGLVGCNTALDRELAAVIAADFGDPAVREAYDAIAARRHDLVIERVALSLADAVADGGSLAALRHVAADPVARDAVRARADEAGTFEAVAAWQLLRVDQEPSRRAAAVAELAALARTEQQADLIGGLYGEEGPAGAEQHLELLEGWRRGGRTARVEDHRRALDCLGRLPLRPEAGPAALFRAIDAGSRELRKQPEYGAWWLLLRRPPDGRSFVDWATVVARLRPQLSQLPPARQEEIRALAADVAIFARDEDGYLDGLETLLRAMDTEWPAQLGEGLARALAVSANPERLLAHVFVQWLQLPAYAPELLDVALPAATGDLPPKRLAAVGERLRSGREEWELWLEEHPPRRAVSRAVRGVLRRGERD
jgi:hypothetical protein